jgi:hypothetical protein
MWWLAAGRKVFIKWSTTESTDGNYWPSNAIDQNKPSQSGHPSFQFRCLDNIGKGAAPHRMFLPLK